MRDKNNGLRCPQCGGDMILLFLSAVCDRCEASPSTDGFDRGYIVWRGRPAGSCEYVFKTRADAERWRDASGLNRFPIRSVLSRTEFRWRRSTGSASDIELADRLFEIFPDDTHEPGPNRAFIEP